MKQVCFCWLCVILLAGCAGQSHTGDLQSPPLFGDEITGDAQVTQTAYLKAINAGTEKSSTEIPAAYWANGIKQLNPIKVYTHRINIVVVQRVTDRTEEGKYIYIPFSSYLPQSGDDGFVFSPNPGSGNTYTLGNGVFDFKRTAGN